MPPDLKAVTVQTKALTQAEEDSSANSPNEVTDLNSKTTVSRSSSYSKYGNTIFSSNRCGLEPLAANTVIQKLERIVNEVIGIGQLNVTSTDGAGDSHILSYIVQLAACARSALILSEVKRHALENEIEKDVSDALKQLFGFWLSKFVHIHGRVDLSGGLLPSEDVQVYRTALFMATLSGRGSKSVPVLYFPKNAASLNIIGRLKSCWSLIGGPVGVSTAIFRCVPISKIGETIDITSLLTFMDEDISHGRRPCLLFCNAGTPQAGQVDELRKLREICDQYNCWMHVEGDQLYALMTSTLSRSSSIRPVHSLIDAARLADSVTVNLNGAFALSGNVLPAITFFQNIDPRQEDPLLAFEFQEFPEPHSHLSSTNLDKAIAPLRHPTTSLELTLPLWVTLSNETNKLKVFYAKAREL
ncbi:hypothetical protein BC829DRAFT_302379 [Chytridium lagenaria]|nr:hypothetical protein BC829DRAFT_302379 [Chytridium lagenaria]